MQGLHLRGSLSKLLNPRMDIHSYHNLLSAIRTVISEDQCTGRFIFNRQIFPNSTIAPPLQPPPPLGPPPPLSSSGPGGDNPKSQLQTMLARAGYSSPIYITNQLNTSQFRSIVEFNGTHIMGRPWNNKKQAEKDAANEAIEWLLGKSRNSHEYVDQMSNFLKKSKKDHQ